MMSDSEELEELYRIHEVQRRLQRRRPKAPGRSAAPVDLPVELSEWNDTLGVERFAYTGLAAPTFVVSPISERFAGQVGAISFQVPPSRAGVITRARFSTWRFSSNFDAELWINDQPQFNKLVDSGQVGVTSPPLHLGGDGLRMFLFLPTGAEVVLTVKALVGTPDEAKNSIVCLLEGKLFAV